METLYRSMDKKIFETKEECEEREKDLYELFADINFYGRDGEFLKPDEFDYSVSDMLTCSNFIVVKDACGLTIFKEEVDSITSKIFNKVGNYILIRQKDLIPNSTWFEVQSLLDGAKEIIERTSCWIDDNEEENNW